MHPLNHTKIIGLVRIAASVDRTQYLQICNGLPKLGLQSDALPGELRPLLQLSDLDEDCDRRYAS